MTTYQCFTMRILKASLPIQVIVVDVCVATDIIQTCRYPFTLYRNALLCR